MDVASRDLPEVSMTGASIDLSVGVEKLSILPGLVDSKHDIVMRVSCKIHYDHELVSR
jgi:hypothetical protein